MAQVNSLGTGGTFTADAKKYGFDPTELAESVRFWFQSKPDYAPDEGKYQSVKGKDKFWVAFKYLKSKSSLSCMSVTKMT